MKAAGARYNAAMRLELSPHRETPCDAVSSIAVEVVRAGAALSLRYLLTGDVAALAIPPVAASARADELWRHTCFEAFLAPDPGGGYFEFNLAPSTRWAAYAFAGYRDGMAPAAFAPPRIVVAASEATLELAAQLNLAAPALPPGPCRLALSAVIEAGSGAKSYWALAHPPGKPDFHHRSSFAYVLPA